MRGDAQRESGRMGKPHAVRGGWQDKKPEPERLPDDRIRRGSSDGREQKPPRR